MTFGRRALLGGLGAAALVSRGARADDSPFVVSNFDFDDTGSFPKRALVLVPKSLPAGEKLPVAVLFHGRGAAKDGASAIRGWLDRWGLGEAHSRLSSPPIAPGELLGTARATQLDEALAKKAYRGLVLVCPFTPDAYRLGLSRTFDELATFTGGPLLSRVEREIAAADTSRLGIGGASLGGFAAIEVMARIPARFAAAAVVQPALETSPPEHFATRMITGGTSGLRATVITSRGDPFRKVSDALAAALAKKGIDATLRVSKGAHDAAFLREVGSLEMTFALERALG